MRLFDATSPEIEAADASPWDGPLAGTTRPFTHEGMTRVLIAAAVLYFAAGLAGALGAGLGYGLHNTPWMFITCGSTAAGFVLALLPFLLEPRALRRVFPALICLGTLGSAGLLGVIALLSGPDFSAIAATYWVEPVLFSFFCLRRRWALTCGLWTLAIAGGIFALQDGWLPNQSAGMIIVSLYGIAASVLATAVVVGTMAEHADVLAASEHRARQELAEVNRTLEARVDEQVTEIERLGSLRRFLSPQVADTVLAAGASALAEPHRQKIAVIFCDLRGFTRFTRKAEPEEVIAVLHDYYATVGEVLQSHKATIGGYAGDGVMAYFGDPVPHEAPALAAVTVATQVRDPLDKLAAQWGRRGFEIGYGIGIAYGYATLGVVGFDGRFDYTPIGSVVNLAARLCARCANGQVLLDHAAHVETSDDVRSVYVSDVELKGYEGPIRAYTLI
jgi:class 3 adenylate cyclase